MPPDNRRHERLTFQGTIFIEKVARGLGSHEGEVVGERWNTSEE